jgi:hypothetical protein
MRYLRCTFCYLLIFFTFFFPGCINDEKKAETSLELFRRFSVETGGVFFSVPPKIAAIFLDDQIKGNAELKVLLSEVDNLSFLIIRNKCSVKESKVYEELNKALKEINFQDLAMVNSGNELIFIKIFEEGNEIKEIAVLVSNYESFYCISFRGTISPQKVAELTKPENMEAIVNLNRLKF